ncbi:MAG: hypothetical protein M0Q49_11055 [Porticoccaceae bacterium]|nr:hypothetical protein [Porticoccaceae bacterium]
MTNTAPSATIDMGQFLAISINTLRNYFFDVPRAKSRRLYKEIAAGDQVTIATLTRNNDKSTGIKLKLALDHTEFKGHLTFHLFQQVLGAMLRHVANYVQRKEDLNIFTSEETGEILVFRPGLIEDKGQLNVLVLGIAPTKGGALIKLQFLDPEQFRRDNPDARGEQAKPAANPNGSDEN